MVSELTVALALSLWCLPLLAAGENLAAGKQRLAVKLDEHRSRVLWIRGK
jgi:hypothetical protein